MRIVRIIYFIFNNLKAGILFKLMKFFLYLKRSQFQPLDEIIEVRDLQVKKLISFLQTSMYYKGFLFEGTNHKSLLDFPQLTKADYKTHYNQFKTVDFTSRFQHSTSGSSGDPLKISISSDAAAMRKALVWRFLSWYDCAPFDRSALIWGKKQTNPDGFLASFKSILRGRYDIDVFKLNDATIMHIFKELDAFRPAYFRGYKSAVYEFALLMKKYNLKFKRTKLKVVIVTSEVLYPEEREMIENVFSCRVANEYGAAEAGLFAVECPFGGMHINEESQEFQTDSYGNVIVTEVYNTSMPLVNYKVGDNVVFSEKLCKCGRQSRILQRINGRESESIVLKDGRRLSQYVFYYIFKELDDIGLQDSIIKYKVEQHNDDFRVLLVPGPFFSSKVIEYIESRMCALIGKGITVEFNIVDAIERDLSGKLRFFQRMK